MMYVGIGSEKGKKVRDEDAFPYACERINNGTEREQEAFMQIMKEAEEFLHGGDISSSVVLFRKLGI
ncbi:MAG: hypothetical protein ACLT1J_10550 [Mediterraneibacter gnavus]